MSWLTKPDASCYELRLPNTNAEAAKMLYKLNKGVFLTDEQLEAFWMAFKIEKFDGVNWYERETKVYSHFMQWLKYQNAVEVKQVSKTKQPEDTPLNRLKMAYRANMRNFPIEQALEAYELIKGIVKVPADKLEFIEEAYERGSDKWKKAIVTYFFDNN